MKKYTMILSERENIIIQEEKRKILKIEAVKLECKNCMKNEWRTSISKEIKAEMGSILFSVSTKNICLNINERKEIVDKRREQRKEIREKLLNYILDNI